MLSLSLFSLALGLYPAIHRYRTTPPDLVYVGTEFYSDDYSIYVSNILQGQNGRWTLLDKHTSELHSGTIIHNEYLLWGKLTKLFGINQIVSFHLARFIFGAVFLFLSYRLLLLVFPVSSLARLLSFFFLIFSASLPILKPALDVSNRWHLSWLTEIDAAIRTTVLPHYLLGYIFFLLSGILLLRSISAHSKQSSTRLFLYAVLSGSLLALIHPVNLVTLDTTLALFLILSTVLKFIHTRKFEIWDLGLGISFILLTSPPLLYLRSQFSVLPWSHMKQWENVTGFYSNLAPIREYALALGPIFFLGIIGIGIFILSQILPSRYAKLPFFSWLARSRSPEQSRGMKGAFQNGRLPRNESYAGEAASNDNLQQPANLLKMAMSGSHLAASYSGVERLQYNSNTFPIFLLSWILSFFFLIYYSYPFLHISQVRFMQNPIFLPFAVFAALGTINFAQWIKTIPKFFGRRASPFASSLVISLIVLTTVVIFIPTAIYSTKTKLAAYNGSSLAFPTRVQVDGFTWLARNTSHDDAVLALYEASTLIPFMSGNTIYAGHLWASLNWAEKSQRALLFFSGNLPADFARDFLISNRIKYIYYGYQEQSMGGNIAKYPFLTIIYSNPAVQIFRVIE